MTDTFTRILVPVDFSPQAERAFRYATSLAYRFGAKLALLHVVEHPVCHRRHGVLKSTCLLSRSCWRT